MLAPYAKAEMGTVPYASQLPFFARETFLCVVCSYWGEHKGRIAFVGWLNIAASIHPRGCTVRAHICPLGRPTKAKSITKCIGCIVSVFV